jgi:hypothetical protein
VTVQVPVPLQAPPQPPNSEPLAAVEVRVTTAPWLYVAVHVPGHEIPEPVTVPEPEPPVVTVSVSCGGGPVFELSARFCSVGSYWYPTAVHEPTELHDAAFR